MLLKIKDLNFNYPDKEIFSSFDLQAPAGKIIHINGPSGAGKTTLLHLIAGIQSPQTGAITLGEEVFFNNDQELLIEEIRVGLVFATGFVTSLAPITKATSAFTKSLFISSSSNTSSYGTFASANKTFI